MQHLLSRLISKGVRLIATPEDELKIQLGSYKLTDTDTTAIKAHKSKILEYLNGGKIACQSYSQERLWFLAQLGYGSQYHVPAFGRIAGVPNFDALSKALDFISVRHECLRTNFGVIENTPVQRIQPVAEVIVERVDLSHLPMREQAQQQKLHLQSFIERPFDLELDVLFRVIWVKLAADVHILGLCLHHIITDGWSMRVLVRDLSAAYNAFCVGKQPELKPLTLDYAAYAVWERETLTDEKLSRELDYWQTSLTGYENLAMPLDFVRPAQSSGKGGYRQFFLTQEQGRLIKLVSRERKTTAFTLFMSAVYTLLKKYSGQSDICMGMPVANRYQSDLEDLVGFFVNTLVIRINPPDEPCLTVDQLLAHVHQVIVEGQDNQNAPIEKILDLLQPERDLSRSPIFQVLINYTPLTLGKIPFGNCLLEPLFDFEIKEAKFDLTFTYNEFEDEHAVIGIEYASDLFNEATIDRMAAQLAQIVVFFLEAQTLPLAQIEMVSPEERMLLVDEWNKTAKDFPVGVCVHELFGRQAAKTPENVAVIFADQQLTYRQLNAKSEQLALYLQACGVRPDSLVAVCINRSLEMPVALLGILKAGGAYLPLDPTYPEARIQMLVQDSGIRLIVTLQNLATRLSVMTSIADCRLISLDSDWTDIARSQGGLNTTVNATHLAYVIYTSGTTGQPKGVMVEHRNVVNHNLAVIDAYQLTERDRVLQFSTISFDIFVEEVFPTLLVGAAVVLMDGDRFTDLRYFRDSVYKQRVSLINLPTAYWHTLVEESFAGSGLTRVIIGGEKAEIDKLKSWRRLNPAIRVINTYGPTEATVISLLYDIPDDVAYNKPIPIGRPIANTQAFILDQDGRLLPPGIPGELHLAGAGLARGYLHSPALTAEKFITHPGLAGGLRLYKTGDRARWLPEGQIDFVGRVDQQVKIRGFRVELGEIEAALTACPGLETSVVIAKNRQGLKQLIAFYTQAPNTAPIEADAVKAFLRQHVPDYMIPVACVKLDAAPLTPSGKINRKALEDYQVILDRKQAFAAPETALEVQLVALWEELLCIKPVGLDDNFFELGGHSLLTVQLLNRVNQLLNETRLSLADIFKYPTVKALAAHLQTPMTPLQHSSYIINLRQSTPTFIVPGMPGLSDGYVELAECLRHEGPVYGLQMQGYADDQPATTVAAMAAHNIAQIRTLQSQGLINLYAHSYGGTVVYEMLQQLQATDLQVGSIVLIDSGVLLKPGVVDKVSVTAFFRFMLSNSGINPDTVKDKLEHILNTQPSAQWKHLLAALMQQTAGLDAAQFLKIWDVLAASITVDYRYGPKLPYAITLVIAEGSKGWLVANCWDAYFDKVRVIRAQGEHFSVVRRPYCAAWLQELAPQANDNSAMGLASKVLPAVANQTLLSIRQLEKQYADVKAVDGVSFDIRQGSCFGLLGPNGAGKTTTLEMLEGITKPTRGEIHFRGAPINRDYTQHIGIQFQHTALQDLLTAKESLQLFQKLYKNSLPLDEIIAACALEEFLHRDTRKLSGGQRQRLLLGIALINDPDLIFLDEPTTGLDPQARHNFWSLIRGIKQRGKTIVLTTHYMEEAEQLCDQIAIMDKGRILVQDAPDKLLQQHFDGVVIRLPKSSGLAQQQGFPLDVYVQDEWVEFNTPDVEAAIGHLTHFQVPLDGLSVAAPNLENLFLKLTGHALRS